MYVDRYVRHCYNENNRTHVRSGGNGMIEEIVEIFKKMNGEQKEVFIAYLEKETLRIQQLSAECQDHAEQCNSNKQQLFACQDQDCRQ